MSTLQGVRLGAVLEGPSDARAVPGLIDRFLREAFDYLGETPEYLDGFRTWSGAIEGTRYLAWRDVARAARGRVPRRHGHFAGEPGEDDAQRAVLALRLFTAMPDPPRAVVLVRDSDGRAEERRKGLEQAREDGQWPFVVVLGVAHFMIEAWTLAGFIPDTDEEKQRLEAERKSLGVYPNREPHALNAREETAKRSPKRALEALTSGDSAREERCWREAPPEVLNEHGEGAGLRHFIDEVQRLLVPAMR
ncbi:hypothetical protein [Chondromyces apiculatus]|uniref:DUF4276 family protein n=1 Tax=Chondromyces apiculatus DSM 436 TaxID=1192034 RepID=A0A017T9C1_9BACT|nr:hypothetical protein [Chondromyces apiculatus]EYF05201.1 Hypothetical protein CAP_3566 [Chondromyces apiculatus DSM 436]